MTEVVLILSRSFFDFSQMRDVEVENELTIKEEHFELMKQKLRHSFMCVCNWIETGSRLRVHTLSFGGKKMTSHIFMMQENEYVIDLKCAGIKTFTNDQLTMLFNAIEQVVDKVNSYQVCYDCTSQGNVITFVISAQLVEDFSMLWQIENKGEAQAKLL